MFNKLLNAVIALVENKPEVARTLLRSPDMKGASISEVQSRLYDALDKIKAEAARAALRGVMQRSLRLSVLKGDTVEEEAEVFMTGVVAVETLLEEAIAELEP